MGLNNQLYNMHKKCHINLIDLGQLQQPPGEQMSKMSIKKMYKNSKNHKFKKKKLRMRPCKSVIQAT